MIEYDTRVSVAARPRVATKGEPLYRAYVLTFTVGREDSRGPKNLVFNGQRRTDPPLQGDTCWPIVK